MFRKKSRFAYGYHRDSGKVLVLGDTVAAALKENMFVREYEDLLIKANPQLDISFKVEYVED